MIFVDTETTGLDRDKGKDITSQHKILEIGLVVYQMPEMVEIAAWSTPIRYPKHQILEAMNDYVLKMHTENGLLSEILNEKFPHNNVANGGLPSVWEAEKMAIEFVQKYQDPGATSHPDKRPEMCGANPGFEKMFFATHMPNLLQTFHYRTFDTNTFWLTRKFFGDWDGVKEQQPHRAVPDCRREFQALVEHFTWAGQVLRGER
jgi:oligoribonuclease (3'-5' exoribonuclease)